MAISNGLYHPPRTEIAHRGRLPSRGWFHLSTHRQLLRRPLATTADSSAHPAPAGDYSSAHLPPSLQITANDSSSAHRPRQRRRRRRCPASDATAAEYASDPLAWLIPPPPARCQPLPPPPPRRRFLFPRRSHPSPPHCWSFHHAADASPESVDDTASPRSPRLEAASIPHATQLHQSCISYGADGNLPIYPFSLILLGQFLSLVWK